MNKKILIIIFILFSLSLIFFLLLNHHISNTPVDFSGDVFSQGEILDSKPISNSSNLESDLYNLTFKEVKSYCGDGICSMIETYSKNCSIDCS